jgi:putative membrane protein
VIPFRHMSAREFDDEEARKRVTATIGAIEEQTAAEIVVTVRPRSGSYRAADFLSGFVGAEVALVLILFLPQEFWLETIPADVLVGFVVGALACALVPGVRRVLTPRRTREAQVLEAARAAFVAQRIMGTKTRAGILVYVSLLERHVEVVPDVGVDTGALGAAWTDAVAGLRAAMRPPGVDAFVTALARLAPPLARALPHRDDDVNELPDEVVA